MRLSTSSLTFALPCTLLTVASLVGCAAETADVEPESDSDAFTAAASSRCSSAQYRSALATYRKTVTNARRRLAGRTCEAGTTQQELVSDAGAAIEQCSSFVSVYANSPWAKPVRDALAGNLGLAMITGKLVPVEGGRVVYRGLGPSLPGTTFYGPAPGAYGNVSKLTFREGRAAVASSMSLDAEGTPVWTDTNVTYTVRGTSVVVTSPRGVTEYVIEQEDLDTGLPLPAFSLRPKAGGDAMLSLPSECGG